MIRYKLKRYDENILTFDRLCRILQKSASEVLFAIQTECIEQNKFFWGIVREQYEKASAEAEQRFRDRLKAMMGDDSPKNTKRLWEAFDRLNDATDPRERCNLHQVAPEKEEPEQAGEIKKLYRTLCLRHHPDKAGVYNDKLWLEIQDAYEKGRVKKLREISRMQL
ncbi:MAG: J domain-containing protein [Lentisphaeria bacterium]|nr:J domain-containing protein [Lentisphaeria bacterium]